jgi:tRNA modification GTPase
MNLFRDGEIVMDIFAAVMTGQGAGAIATIQLFGDSAETILREIFRRKGGKSFEPVDGRILLGGIIEDAEIIDEVTVGREGPHTFAIHCHGNPLIVARIMELLRRHGAQAVPPEQLLARIFASQKTGDPIGIEAKLALITVKTMEGAAIISNQVKAGLSARLRHWRDHLDSMSLEAIATEAGDVLRHSEPARLILSGCTIALVGPANTGKSTLLNTLAGREKAIVSDIRGTTRDWVSAEIHIPPLAATIIDTAGLDPALAASPGLDQAAQQASMGILERADVLLLILDLSQPAGQIPEDLMDKLAHQRTIVVLNKADLPSRFDLALLPSQLGLTVQISAKQGRGIDDLIHAIHRVCSVADFDPRTPVAFTDRQKHLLESLQRSDSKAKACSILSELLESLPWGTGGRFPAEV